MKGDAQAHEKLLREELFVSLMKQPQGVNQHLWCVKPFNLETSPQG
jgi:hypothetical protein